MIRKIRNKLAFFRTVRLIPYLYLNYFCKSVIRIDSSKIIPYKNAVLDINPTAKIYLANGDIEVGRDQLKKSKAETRVRLREGAVWSSQNGCALSYNVTLELLKDAILDTGYFTVNSNTVVITADRMSFGQDVMIARNAVIFDSDFHSMLDQNGNTVNYPKKITIGNHVWIGANVTVLKGTTIGDGCVISAGSIVHGNIEDHVVFRSSHSEVSIRKFSGWDRKAPVKE